MCTCTDSSMSMFNIFSQLDCKLHWEKSSTCFVHHGKLIPIQEITNIGQNSGCIFDSSCKKKPYLSTQWICTEALCKYHSIFIHRVVILSGSFFLVGFPITKSIYSQCLPLNKLRESTQREKKKFCITGALQFPFWRELRESSSSEIQKRSLHWPSRGSVTEAWPPRSVEFPEAVLRGLGVCGRHRSSS